MTSATTTAQAAHGPEPSAARDATALLTMARAAVRPVPRVAVDTLPPAMRLVAGNHAYDRALAERVRVSKGWAYVAGEALDATAEPQLK